MIRHAYLALPGDLQTQTGGYVYARRMTHALRELGWQMEILSLPGAYPQPEAAARHAANALFAGLPTESLVLWDGLALGALPDVAHGHAARLRLVALVHHPLAFETGLLPRQADQLRASECEALQAVRRVVVTSDRTRKLLASYHVRSECIAVVVPGCDRAPLARRRHLSAGTRQLLCVATLTPRKGHELLLEALHTLQPAAWHLSCVGSTDRHPAHARAIRDRIAALGLADRVTLTGELSMSELRSQFLASDLFVLPTLYEGYGMAVAEALAYALPVVATDTGAIPDLLASGAGRCVPAGDIVSLTRALAELLDTPGTLASCAAAAERSRYSLPSWAEQARRLADVLESVNEA